MKRKNFFNKNRVFALIGSLLLLPMTLQAKTTFYLEEETDCVSPNCGGWDNSRVYEDTNGNTTVGVTGVYASANTAISQGQVESWSGLGVRTGLNDPYQGVPWHATDNLNGEFEMILFDFGAGNLMSLNEVKLGYYGNDSDLSIAAYTANTGGINSNVSILGQTWEQLVTPAGGWEYVATANNPGTSTFSFNGNGDYESRYWLVGTYNTSLAGGGTLAGYADAGKLQIVAGNLSSPCTHNCGGGGNGVPVPAPALLMLGGLGLINRKKLFS